MSVYTWIDPQELETFLLNYNVGNLLDYQGISVGVENSNYFVTTSVDRYVLTLFESIGFDDLPYYLDLMAFLSEHKVPSAHPLADREGNYLRRFKDKPAALVQRLSGTSIEQPNILQCQAIGAAMGRLHRVGQAFSGRREHTRGPRWRRATGQRLLAHLDGEDAELLRAELHFQEQYGRTGLPWGVIHGDLFRDNALFVGDELTGIIDFYYACNNVLLYDLAVTVNDWCFRADGLLEREVLALLTAYHEQRPLQDNEHKQWPQMLRVAALRFWLSRLQDKLFPRPSESEMILVKDPDECKHILVSHVAHNQQLFELWV